MEKKRIEVCTKTIDIMLKNASLVWKENNMQSRPTEINDGQQPPLASSVNMLHAVSSIVLDRRLYICANLEQAILT